MFSLFQIMTLEGWPEIARAVWNSPQWYMLFMILIFIMISSFAIMNTVLAVIVEHTLSEAMEQRSDVMKKAEQQLHLVANELVMIFASADEDKSGALTRTEFVEGLSSAETRRMVQKLDLGDDFGCLDLEEIGILFDTIDVDESGHLSPQEFVEGLMQMRGTARARRLFEMHCALHKMHNKTQEKLQTMQEQYDKKWRSVEQDVKSI